MTVSTSNNRNSYTASGGQTVFPYTFKVFLSTDILVYQNGVLKTLATHYTVSNVGVDGGGNVTLVTGATAGDKIILLRSISFTQGTVYPNNDKFPARSHENALDRLTMLCQQLNEVDQRALLLPQTSLYSALSVPDPSAAKFLRWKADLTGLENADVTGAGSISIPVSIAQGGTSATTDNAARAALATGHQFDHDPVSTTGLTWGYKAGLNPKTGAVIAAGTVALTASQTNYVELDPNSGTVSANTSGFTTGRVPIRKLVTDSGSITTNTDNRNQLGTTASFFNPIANQVFGG